VGRAALVVAIIHVAVAVSAYLLAAATVPMAPHAVVRMPWLVLLGLFAATQASPLHVEGRHHSRSISLTELPFVVGLLSVGPIALCVARAVAGVGMEIGLRRQYRQPVKLAFNASLFASEALLTAAVFRWIDYGHASQSPLTWVAAVVAATAGNMLSCLSVTWLLEVVDGSRSPRAVMRIASSVVWQSLVVANVGLVAALTVATGEWAAIPLAGAVAAFAIGYRSYAVANERHARLQHLYTFNRAITGHTEHDDVVATLLLQVEDILNAQSSRLVRMAGGDGDWCEYEISEGALRQLPAQWLLETDGWIVGHVAERQQPLLLGRGTTDPAAAEWLRRNGLREALLVAVSVDDDGAVLVVADRLGDLRRFDGDDLKLLETIAQQAAVQLRSGRLVHRLRYDSLHDAVTGIPNRAALQQRVEQQLADCNTTIALGMIDLDAFKDVNDSFGHHSGDQMLMEIASRIVATVAGRGDVCRFGGDEFAVALYGVTTAAAASFFRDLIEQLSAPIEMEGTAIEVGASIGVAVAPEQAITWAELVRKADVAMYAAKSAGRVVVVFDETLDGAGPSRLGLVAALHRAIDNDELEVHVQPKASLESGAIVSSEALVRWTHADMGPMNAGEFVALAERSGLIRDLTDRVLDKAVAACAGWQRVAPGVGVAVNVSARCLQDDSLEITVERALRRHRLSAPLLTLEITESSIMADPERTSGLLHRLRKRGVRLSIDDFGTGYSSLSYLRRLPVSEVKIDQSFVARMQESSDDAAIVQAIVELGHTLDLEVVAEGVEDQMTWDLLRVAGCDLAQGYLLAKPMPAGDFARWYGTREPMLRAANPR
jgi:diguanylate cyclase (GGDEF)-like protein